MSDDHADGGTPDQWRVDNAGHLAGLALHFRRYTPRSEGWDHDHCAACWAKFTEFAEPGALREGYATGSDYPKGPGYDWVCQPCFEDLMSVPGWRSA